MLATMSLIMTVFFYFVLSNIMYSNMENQLKKAHENTVV
ncbi:MAG: hypothetical protein K0R31_1934, partial [Clostridiales bacterium]|nr:hypothetical protein [Clostridiales bacterium]